MSRIWSFILCAFVCGCCGVLFCNYVQAQIRPVIDEGTVKETTRKPSITTVNPARGSKVASKPNNAVLFVVTDQDGAEVLVNGEKRGKATGNQLRLELPAGRRYSIEVTAGDDYLPYKETVVLKSGLVVNASLVSKFGTVSMGPTFPEGAKVLVDGQPVKPQNVQVDKAADQVVISGLTPGAHTITYDHPDYVIAEHKFDISPGSSLSWAIKQFRAVDDLVVATDVGAAIYVDGQKYGETAADGSLKISVPLGSHEIKVEKYSYEPYKEKDEFKFRNPISISRKLVPIANSAEFHEDFDIPDAAKSKWSMPPSGWKLQNGRFYLENCSEVAFPKALNYRDFTMGFHLKVENGQGAAWALRVKDSRNYYLFYLTGQNGPFPNRFLTYVVHDGKLDPGKPDDSVPLIFRLESGGEYSVDITVTGNIISHVITSAKTGKGSPSGEFKDNDNYFPFGGIGFRTVGSERFSVDEIYVRPPSVKPSS